MLNIILRYSKIEILYWINNICVFCLKQRSPAAAECDVILIGPFHILLKINRVTFWEYSLFKSVRTSVCSRYEMAYNEWYISNFRVCSGHHYYLTIGFKFHSYRERSENNFAKITRLKLSEWPSWYFLIGLQPSLQTTLHLTALPQSNPIQPANS